MNQVRHSIRFLLNDRIVDIADMHPVQTLLDYLRLAAKLKGSKEGCGEGDCGACTVLVGKLVNGTLIYESVNACIRFLASLDGCHVVTIEHLRGTDGGLHPVQRAMVDFHGSQCGFCTPGFVMSLYALWMRDAEPSDQAIEKALQGNLCRCTGYEAIMRAARSISHYGKAQNDPLASERANVAKILAGLHDRARVEIGSGKDRAVIPANLDDFAQLLEQEPKATIVAGSTDVGLWVTKMMRDITPVIFIGNLQELRAISEKNGVVTIGAGVTYSEAFAFLSGRIPALGQVINRIGGEQVRNMGTIGGNIANGSPIGDSPPALIALGARLVLRLGKTRRTIPLEQFFIEYGKQDRRAGEFVEAVEVPLPAKGSQFEIYKISKRRDEDITTVLGAFYLERDAAGRVSRICIAYGGMAGTPKRAGRVEAALLGKPWNEQAIASALPLFGQDYQPLSDARATAAYRALVAQNLLRRFLLATTGDAAAQISAA